MNPFVRCWRSLTLGLVTLVAIIFAWKLFGPIAAGLIGLGHLFGYNVHRFELEEEAARKVCRHGVSEYTLRCLACASDAVTAADARAKEE
jgi:hypothetical protein